MLVPTGAGRAKKDLIHRKRSPFPVRGEGFSRKQFFMLWQFAETNGFEHMAFHTPNIEIATQ